MLHDGIWQWIDFSLRQMVTYSRRTFLTTTFIYLQSHVADTKTKQEAYNIKKSQIILTPLAVIMTEVNLHFISELITL